MTDLLDRLRWSNGGSGVLARLPDSVAGSAVRLQTSRLPLFSPVAPTIGTPPSAVDRTAFYAGDTGLRLTSVMSAHQTLPSSCRGENGVMSGVLFFDGVCGMCTRSRNLLVRLDRTGDLETVPLQHPGTSVRLGVAASRLAESAWWLDSSGAVYGGAEAINAAVSAAIGTRLPLLIYRTPGVRSLQDAVYRWVATHRYRFPGTTPYCESHPAAC